MMSEGDTVQILHRAGLRATSPRVRILRLLRAAHNGRPVSAESLAQQGRGTFDVSTVYRTLNVFVATGLARRIEVDAGRTLFEPTFGKHHHHVVCTSCGDIRDVSVCVPASFIKKARQNAGFDRIESHRLEFFGLCRGCVAV